MRRGDIYYADLSPVIGSEQGGIRPVLIVQNNMGNRYSPTVIAAAITSKTGKTKLPTHIEVQAGINANDKDNGLLKNSVILLEQIRTIDKQRLKERMGKLDERTMQQVDGAIGISFGLS
ncbi:MAG: type II toxin-antitoxin system PemK/MazF family toxin [Clostridia bacterium]|nr:type II toxin-antitoxin system PemK/MazF family toxin [Clostridia bacterium]